MTSAMIPPKHCADALVPLPSYNCESAALVELYSENVRNPTFEAALSETSGVSREPSAGTPGATCQEGLGYTIEGPPPVAQIPLPPVTDPLSFQVVSGTYDFAER